MIRFFLIGIFIVVLTAAACRSNSRTERKFSSHPNGYYYRLLSFYSDTSLYIPDQIAWINACFSNQNDSVFWDSDNNLNDGFYMLTDSGQTKNLLRQSISKFSALDSVCVLIPTHQFFKQQFGFDSIPFFSKTDSIVKINFKIKKLFRPIDFDNVAQNLKEKEIEQIERFFGSPKKLEEACDPAGFYWVEKPSNLKLTQMKPGDLVTLHYEASYLNGRFLEKSPANFEFIYGTPDQLLKGLNYAINRLKVGENVKIILPSHLAFGKQGSSNGLIPPYTPLIYQIKIIDIKTNTNSLFLKAQQKEQRKK